MPDCIYYINKLVLRTHARKVIMGSKKLPIPKPLPRPPIPGPIDPGLPVEPAPPMPKQVKPKLRKTLTDPLGANDMENPNQVMQDTKEGIGSIVSKVGEQMVPDTMRRNKKRTANQGALGSSGSLL